MRLEGETLFIWYMGILNQCFYENSSKNKSSKVLGGKNGNKCFPPKRESNLFPFFLLLFIRRINIYVFRHIFISSYYSVVPFGTHYRCYLVPIIGTIWYPPIELVGAIWYPPIELVGAIWYPPIELVGAIWYPPIELIGSIWYLPIYMGRYYSGSGDNVYICLFGHHFFYVPIEYC